MSRRLRAIRSAMSATRESDLYPAVRDYLASLGLRPFRADATLGARARRSGAVGLPDFFSVLPGGQFLAIELKRKGARRRENEAKQDSTLTWLRDQGSCVILASSIEQVAAVINIASVGKLRAAWAVGESQRIASPPESAIPRQDAGRPPGPRANRLGRNQLELEGVA